MNIKRKEFSWLQLLLWIVGVEIIGSLSALLSGNIRQSYQALQLPPLSPPGGLFGPVWIALYVLIGISGYLITKDTYDRREKRKNLVLYFSQLFINGIWTVVFFRLNGYWLGTILIIALVVLVTLCIKSFHKVNRNASYLLLPYLAWVLFATYLSIGVAVLN